MVWMELEAEASQASAVRTDFVQTTSEKESGGIYGACPDGSFMKISEFHGNSASIRQFESLVPLGILNHSPTEILRPSHQYCTEEFEGCRESLVLPLISEKLPVLMDGRLAFPPSDGEAGLPTQ